MLHQEIRGIQFKQRAKSDNGNEQLADDDTFHRPDKPDSDTAKDFRQGCPEIDLGEGINTERACETYPLPLATRMGTC